MADSLPKNDSQLTDSLIHRTHTISPNSDSNDSSCKLPKKRPITSLIAESLKEFLKITFFFGFINFILYELFSLDSVFLTTLVSFFVSVIATYYKYRLWKNPDYKSQYCNCVKSDKSPVKESAMNGILTVLDHKKGSLLLNIPNSLFGILFYGFIFSAHYYKYTDYIVVNYLINLLFIVSFFGSLYLWKTMIIEINRICILCMTIHSMNFLNVVRLLM